MALPNFDVILPAFHERPSVRKYAEHNFQNWRRTVGGLALVQSTPRAFDPRLDYWSMPERRTAGGRGARRSPGGRRAEGSNPYEPNGNRKLRCL